MSHFLTKHTFAFSAFLLSIINFYVSAKSVNNDITDASHNLSPRSENATEPSLDNQLEDAVPFIFVGGIVLAVVLYMIFGKSESEIAKKERNSNFEGPRQSMARRQSMAPVRQSK